MSEATKEVEAKWLAERQSGLGGSDAAAALGLSKWKSPYQLWAEKSGVVAAEDLSYREWIEWGHRLEGPIVEAFSERTGREITRWPEYTILRHPDLPWMICTPDAIQEPNELGFKGLLQIETTNAYYAKDWDSEPPMAYKVQLQHELYVTGHAWGSLACLIGGQKLVWFDMEANEKFAKAMVEKEREFWGRVESGDAPPIDGYCEEDEEVER